MPTIKCPICGKAAEWQNNEFRPFCSERCRMIDFGGWIDEEYRVPDRKTAVHGENSPSRSFELPEEDETLYLQ